MIPTDDNAQFGLEIRNLKAISLEDLHYNLRRQGDTMTDIKKELEKLANLAEAVSLLTHQMGNLLDDQKKLDKIQDIVTQHKTLFWIMGAVCAAVFPVLVSWNFRLSSDLRDMQSKLDVTMEKVVTLERSVYTKAGATAYILPKGSTTTN